MTPSHTEEEIRGLHRALYAACGLPSITPSYSALNAWWALLLVLAPLEETEGGKLTYEDVQDVIGEMKRQNKAGASKWSLRPINILRDPELFLDLVLMARQRRSARPPRPAMHETIQTVGNITRQVEQPTEEEVIDVRTAFADLRKKLGGGK